jgi:hypothetical protein
LKREGRGEIMVSIFRFILVLILCTVVTSVSYGIEINPVKERIEDTIKIGESNPGKKIFNTEFVKPAIFGNWPKYGGGLVKSKLVDLAVMAAMMRKARKVLTDENVLSIMESNILSISYRGGGDIFKIKLMQGGRLIEPIKMVKPDMRTRGAKEHAPLFLAIFPYSKLDLNAKTTILVIKDFGEDRHEVDFSRIK